MKPLNKVKIKWTKGFAYAIGLLATDGNLSPDSRHINFTSKDENLVKLFKDSLLLKNKIGKKARGYSTKKEYSVVQFGDVNFYRFLLSVGLTPCKSKTLGALSIPDNLFCHFLRGCIDGDGNISEFKHPQSKIPQLRVRLYSASMPFLRWIKSITVSYGIKGYFGNAGVTLNVLEYAKKDSIKLFKLIYKDKGSCYLERKFQIAKSYM